MMTATQTYLRDEGCRRLFVSVMHYAQRGQIVAAYRQIRSLVRHSRQLPGSDFEPIIAALGWHDRMGLDENIFALFDRRSL